MLSNATTQPSVPACQHGEGLDPERFWQHVDQRDPESCWMWCRATNPKGYGNYHVGKPLSSVWNAHRVAYLISVGEIPDGFQICHSCDTPGCVNPHHLSARPRRENTGDMVEKRRHAYGERSPHAKLSENDVKRIRALARQGQSTRQISGQFSVSVSQIGRIVARTAWRHVQD